MAGFWKCLVNFSQGFLSTSLVLNTLGLRIWQGHEYARATQGAEYAWIKPEYVIIMSQCAWICLNTMNITLNLIKYVGIYQKSSAEHARILNVSDTVDSIKSRHKLLSSYGDRDVFRTLSNIYDATFCKKDNDRVQIRNQKFSGQGRWGCLWN